MTTGTLLFGSTDLASLCTSIQDLSEFWSSADLRGDLPAYPGIDGADALARPVSAQVRTAQVTIVGATLAATEDAVATARAALLVGQTQTVTRRRVTGAGNFDTTQTAIVRSVAERWIAATTCTVLIAVETLSGYWYGASTNIASGAGAHTIAGEVRTRRITLTLAAGAARTISNSTNGYYVQFLTTVPAGGVAIDVEARTATALTGGADLSRYLQWGKAHPMQLDPGSNTLATDAGTFSVDYQPAYL